jgi:acetyltransferase
MSRIIEVARQRGISEIFGEVLRENEPMLRLARALDFKVNAHRFDAEVVLVERPL